MMVTSRRPGSIRRTVGVTGEKDETQETQEARRPPLVCFYFCHILVVTEETKKMQKKR